MLPLEGFKILDLTRLFPGPLASLCLRDLGAEVIKIEQTGIGDGSRHLSQQAFFQTLNRGKKSVALDLKQPQDVKQLLYLIYFHCDVLLESFRPGVLEKLLQIKTIKTDLIPLLETHFSGRNFNTNPLIVSRISAFGQTNPTFNTLPAHDFNLLAMAGVFQLNQREPNETIKPLPIPIVDLFTGYNTATMIVAALLHIVKNKNKLEPIICIDSSMFDNAISAAMIPLSFALSYKQPMSNGKDILTGSIPAYDIYKTGKNGYLSVGCIELHFWSKFIELLFEDATKRRQMIKQAFTQNETLKKQIKKEIEDKLAYKSSEEWEELFATTHQLPIFAIRKPEYLIEHHDLSLERKQIAKLQVTDKETLQVITPPFDFVNFLQESKTETRAPQLGEHNKEYLQFSKI